MSTLRIAALVAASVFCAGIAQAQWGVDRFVTFTQCEEMVKSGSDNFYEPSMLKDHREPGPGERKDKLESRACGYGEVVGGKAWVPIKKGTEFIFRGEEVIAWYKCGNRFYKIVYIPENPPVPAAIPNPPVQVTERHAPPPPAPKTVVKQTQICIDCGNDKSIHIENRPTTIIYSAPAQKKGGCGKGCKVGIVAASAGAVIGCYFGGCFGGSEHKSPGTPAGAGRQP